MVPSTVMLPHTARSHSPSPADPCTEQVPSLSYPARRERRTQATPLSCPVSVSAFPSILPSQKPTENRRAQPRHQPIQACTMRESPSQSLTCQKCLSLTEHHNWWSMLSPTWIFLDLSEFLITTLSCWAPVTKTCVHPCLARNVSRNS